MYETCTNYIHLFQKTLTTGDLKWMIWDQDELWETEGLSLETCEIQSSVYSLLTLGITNDIWRRLTWIFRIFKSFRASNSDRPLDLLYIGHLSHVPERPTYQLTCEKIMRRVRTLDLHTSRSEGEYYHAIVIWKVHTTISFIGLNLVSWRIIKLSKIIILVNRFY